MLTINLPQYGPTVFYGSGQNLSAKVGTDVYRDIGQHIHHVDVEQCVSCKIYLKADKELMGKRCNLHGLLWAMAMFDPREVVVADAD